MTKPQSSGFTHIVFGSYSGREGGEHSCIGLIEISNIPAVTAAFFLEPLNKVQHVCPCDIFLTSPTVYDNDMNEYQSTLAKPLTVVGK